MNKRVWQIVLSIALILIGVIALLDSLKIVQIPWGLAPANLILLFAFGGGGVIFILVFFQNPQSNWWALIPGFTLVGLGLLVSNLFDSMGAAIFLGMIGLSFLAIFFVQRSFWWALIPAGALMTNALVVATVELWKENGYLAGAVFLFGIALTCLGGYFTLAKENRPTWPLYPAGILGVMGVLSLLGAADIFRYLIPAAMIIGGGLIIWLVYRPRKNKTGI